MTSFARQPNGSLVQLAGIAGCIATDADARLLQRDRRSAGADAIAISPDGRFVYVAGGSADSLLVFSRDAATGRLTQLAGAAGCLRANRTGLRAGHAASTRRRRSRSRRTGRRSTSPRRAGTLTSFQRDVDDGTLTQLPLGAGCLSDARLGGCTPSAGWRAPPPSRSRPTGAR